jgi:hypothetical protein
MTVIANETARTVAPAASRRRRTGLWSIAYVSRISPGLSAADLTEIALDAQRRNQALRVTGVLFMTDTRFLQIIEGEHRAVSWLYERIAADPRHLDIVNVLDRATDTRVFEFWSMRLMDEHDLGPHWRRIVLDTIDRAERLKETGGRLKAVEFAHCYAALGNSAPRPHAGPI